MNKRENYRLTRIRLLTFAGVAILHITLLFFVAFNMKTTVSIPEPVAGLMRLLDVQERLPPPPPPEVHSEESHLTTEEEIAETMIEAEELPPPTPEHVGEPGGVEGGVPGGVAGGVPGAVEGYTEPGQIDYLPQHRLTALPVLPEADIIRAIVYPPIAQRSNIEGVVILELFIDPQGNIRSITVLRENPANRGFGEAAVNAFNGIRAKPGEANGVPVASRYRYSIRFTLK